MPTEFVVKSMDQIHQDGINILHSLKEVGQRRKIAAIFCTVLYVDGGSSNAGVCPHKVLPSLAEMVLHHLTTLGEESDVGKLLESLDGKEVKGH